jgi:hypothetical protein
VGEPWATIGHAVVEVPDDDCTVWVADGVYVGDVDIERRFGTSLTVAAVNRLGAVLESSSSVISIKGAQNITIDGFEIRHVEGGDGVVVSVSGRGSMFAENITLRNSIVHDSFDNDLVKINAGVRNAVVLNTITYNPGSGEQHYDLNGVEDVTLRNNIMFNDYPGSGRDVEDVKMFVIIKDSNASGLDLMGSKRVTLDGNVFIGWENGGGEMMVKVGNDGKPYHEAVGVMVENNLFLSNGPDEARAVFGAAGAKDVTFRNNTINHTTAKYQGYLLETKGDNPPNENIVLCNNVWSAGMTDFAKVSDTVGLAEHDNVYWNGGAQVPGYQPDNGMVTDPGLIDALVSRPRTGNAEAWLAQLVNDHGTPNNVVADIADPTCASDHDILGHTRTTPDIGALELQE